MLASFLVVVWRTAFVKSGSHCVWRRTSMHARGRTSWQLVDIWRGRTRKTLHADANYMLLTVVVTGHNCIAVRRRTETQRKHAAQIKPSSLCGMLRPLTYDDALCRNQHARLQRRRTSTYSAILSVNGALMTVGYYRWRSTPSLRLVY